MENYSVAANFSGITPNISQLQDEIEENIVITTNIDHIDMTGDNVDIYFDSNITTPEKDELNLLISLHVPIFNPVTPYNIDIIPRKNNITKSSYRRMAASAFPGASYATAKCVSHMRSGSTSYSIKIYDKNNRQTLVEKTFTNTTESVQDLGALSNLPLSSTQIEISAKVNGSRAFLESIVIFYN